MSMQSILSASMSLSRLQTMQSLHTQTQGRINVLNAELKQDGGESVYKKDAIDELEERSSNIMNNMMDELDDVNESMKPSEEEKTEGAAEKEPDTDKVELSRHPEAGEKAASVEEPVSYDAEGKAVKAEPSGKKVDAKA